MQNATDITVILDSSGSMGPLATEVVTGFNQFLAEQKEDPSPCKVTLYTFANKVTAGATLDLKTFPFVVMGDYQPGGMTALNDAIGQAITDTGKRLEAMAEADRPNKVVVLVITDGEENCSQEYDNAAIKAMIERQTNEFAWTFVYLGANVNAFAEAKLRGINPANAAQYAATPAGVQASYSVASSAMRSMRSSTADASKDPFFTDTDRDKLTGGPRIGMRAGDSIVNPNPTPDVYKNSKA